MKFIHKNRRYYHSAVGVLYMRIVGSECGYTHCIDGHAFEFQSKLI